MDAVTYVVDWLKKPLYVLKYGKEKLESIEHSGVLGRLPDYLKITTACDFVDFTSDQRGRFEYKGHPEYCKKMFNDDEGPNLWKLDNKGTVLGKLAEEALK